MRNVHVDAAATISFRYIARPHFSSSNPLISYKTTGGRLYPKTNRASGYGGMLFQLSEEQQIFAPTVNSSRHNFSSSHGQRSEKHAERPDDRPATGVCICVSVYRTRAHADSGLWRHPPFGSCRFETACLSRPEEIRRLLCEFKRRRLPD